MSNSHKNCLILNADYSPFGIINWQKSMTWYLRYGDKINSPIQIIHFYENENINGVNKSYKLPAVIKLSKYFKFGNCTVNFSRKNVFIRDGYRCQYCGVKYQIKELTYDHVIPRSCWKREYSPTCWENITTACIKCNRKKSNKTPKEAKMSLLNIPIEPQKNIKYLPVMAYLTNIDKVPHEWQLYISQYLK